MRNVIYIWSDSKDCFRSKVRNISEIPETERDARIKNWKLWRWAYDGSSTGQASTDNSEIIIEPYYAYYGLHDMWVLCHMMKNDFDGKHSFYLKNSYYHDLCKYQDQIWLSGLKLGFEQEFFIYDVRTGHPLLFNKEMNKQHGDFYCSVGVTGNGHIEGLVQEIYERACNLGVKCSGWNMEVSPSQGEIQVCNRAINACHDLVFLRYLMWDTLKKYGLYPVFHPKPLGPSWNGSGLHTNISTHKTMDRNYADNSTENYTKKGGVEIERLINKFKLNHRLHIQEYGEHNELRLTGMHETSSIDKFTSGVGSRSTSVRIPIGTHRQGYGYFEDRRPAANADPYRICRRVWETICD